MHKCIVCGNTYDDTKVNRPGVIYHGFPKDECMRRRWLKVFGIDRCFDWHRICSEHFLEENYKPKKKRFLFSNAIPQPYVRNGFPSNSATQSNGVETGNNVILPMEQNIIKNLTYYDESDCIESEFYREKLIGNASVNGFKSPRLTRNNEDMSNKNMLDHALRSGVRCSVKNCFNRLSKNLSLFGYPKNFKLRKMWIEKLGVNKDPAKIVLTGIRVCSAHFELKCFSNIKLKNRLIYGSVPSLYLDNAPPALPVSINEAPVVLSSCEDDQFISPMDYEAAEQTSEGKQNNVKEPPALPVSINEAPVVLSTCEDDQFISPIDYEAAEQTSERKQNNVKEPPVLPVSINEAPVVLSTCEDDQFISPMDYEAAEQTSEGKQNNVKEPPALPVSINEAPVVLSTCEDDQFISPIDYEAAEQTSEGKQNNVKEPPVLPVSINEAPVVLSTCEDDQFISPMDYEAAEQTSEGKQNNVKEPPALPVSINEAPVVLSTCEDDQFISPTDYEAAEQTSEGKQNNVKEPPVLPVSINEAPVVLSTCEDDQFISPMDYEAAEQTSEGKQNNVKEPPALPVSINEAPVVLSTCEDDQFISPIDYEAAEQTSEGKQNNVKEPPALPVSINEAPVVLSTCEENNVKDNTDHTSMIIDLTIDDSSNSSLSITLEPSEDEHGIIFQLSKKVVLPSLYWKSEHLSTENATRFHEQDPFNVTVKKITFSNNLVPTIEVYGKEYEYKTPITSMKELDDLLEKIDSIEKCYGRGGFVFEQCLGYFENSSVNMCSGCEGLVKDQDLQRMKAKFEAKNKLAQSLNNRIAEQKVLLTKLRKEMAERNRQLALDSNHSALPSGSSNIVKP